MNNTNILIISGTPSNAKLISKIEPLVKLKSVNKIYLVRKDLLDYPKVISYYAPKLLRTTLLTRELFRIIISIYLIIFKKINLIIGIHYAMHCIYSAFLGIIFKIKYIFLIIEDPKLYKNNKLFLFLARRSCFIGVRGKKSKEFLINKGISNIFIPPNVFDFKRVKPNKIKTKKYDLIFIGDFVKEKRVDIFVKVISKLKKYFPDVKTIVLGRGPLKYKTKLLINKYNLQNNIYLAGYKKDVFKYINMSRILISTSETEGFPMVIIEAMSLELPCIVPNIGNITDVTINNRNSLVVKPLSISEYTKACRKLLNSSVLYNKLSKNAFKIRQEKKQEYSLENSMKLWEDAIKSI